MAENYLFLSLETAIEDHSASDNDTISKLHIEQYLRKLAAHHRCTRYTWPLFYRVSGVYYSNRIDQLQECVCEQRDGNCFFFAIYTYY